MPTHNSASEGLSSRHDRHTADSASLTSSPRRSQHLLIAMAIFPHRPRPGRLRKTHESSILTKHVSIAIDRSAAEPVNREPSSERGDSEPQMLEVLAAPTRLQIRILTLFQPVPRKLLATQRPAPVFADRVAYAARRRYVRGEYQLHAEGLRRNTLCHRPFDL
eukprot:2864104-Rhodomonas_salina.1